MLVVDDDGDFLMAFSLLVDAQRQFTLIIFIVSVVELRSAIPHQSNKMPKWAEDARTVWFNKKCHSVSNGDSETLCTLLGGTCWEKTGGLGEGLGGIFAKV